MAADAYSPLAETLERLAHATGGQGRLSDALADSVADLSQRTAIPEEAVIRLLDGGRVDETSVTDRVRQRLEFLLKSRRREDGGRYTVVELASIAEVTRQSFSAWLESGTPSLKAADQLRRFFQLPAGFMTADEPEALNEALRPLLQELEGTSDPLAPLRTPGFLRLARRAPHMDPRRLQLLEEWAEMITESPESRDSTDRP
ncbi:XRE family transcriptional regulator [Streptomyces sp. NPDC051639]|uniref:XRE family transcriptional regulator n=1 Tax=Streptomyces sp. NPDC051639 TaxID=3155671 RepID=UPI00341302CF